MAVKSIKSRAFSALTAAAMTLASVLVMQSSYNDASAASEADVLKYEFEDGETNGGEILAEYTGTTDDGDEVNLPDYSGTGCYYIMQSGTSITVTVNVEEAGLYNMNIRYAQPWDKTKKVQYLDINGVNQGEVTFPFSLSYTETSAGLVSLKSGENTITISSYWGYTFLDYFTLEPASDKITNLKVDKQLINPNATDEAKALFCYLADTYGNYIISGQQEMCGTRSEAEFEYIMEQTGEMPALRGFDFMNYTSFVNWDDQCAERLIEWYNENNGIPALCWHWFSPMGGEKGTSTFYTENTTFSITRALTEGTEENELLMIDIDMMAQKLLQVQEAGVPVLFRPLHEAEGGWFWWGAEGPEPCVELYKLLYDKFTNEYGINNLIWVWNSYTTPESDEWYPGDEYVDLVGYDKYNAKDGLPNLSPITSTFYNLVNLTDGNKMVAMSENDTIPDVNALQEEKAAWLYFCPWYGWWLTGEQNNPKESLIEMYQSEYCITLDELPDLRTYSLEGYGEITTETETDETVTVSETEETITSDEASESTEDGSTSITTDDTSSTPYESGSDVTDDTTAADDDTDTSDNQEESSSQTDEEVTDVTDTDTDADTDTDTDADTDTDTDTDADTDTDIGTETEDTAVTDDDSKDEIDESKLMYGDVNLDGKIDLFDVLELNRGLTGITALSATAAENANCNEYDKGEIDVFDSVMILKYVLGMVVELGPNA